MVLVRNRPRELAPDQVVRQVAKHLQFRTGVEQVEREVQVGGHPVAMSLYIDREIDLFRQSLPSVEQPDAFCDSAGRTSG